MGKKYKSGWQLPAPEKAERGWKEADHLHNLRRSNPTCVRLQSNLARRIAADLFMDSGRGVRWPRGHKTDEHLAALTALAPMERPARSAKWCPYGMAERIADGWKDAKHLHNLRRSNPCKQDVPDMLTYPRGHKTAEHLASLDASDPTVDHSSSFGIPPVPSKPRRGHYPLLSSRMYWTAMGKKRASSWQLPAQREKVARGAKDKAHLDALRQSNPCKQDVPDMVAYPRGYKTMGHFASLDTSDPTVDHRSFGIPPVPSKPRRGHYPLLSSRMYWTAMGKKYKSGWQLPAPEKAERGWKEADHLHNLRMSNPVRMANPNASMRNTSCPNGHKGAVHLKQLRKSSPVKKRQSKKTSQPSIQSIIQAIIRKEDEPKSPRSPRNERAVKKMLGITTEQQTIISQHTSPRLRAKAVGAAILSMRPLSSCARPAISSSPRSMIKQPRPGF